ncbi:hypothetical protein CLOBY_25110 [Clostridium saccharobutylicum]|uniref:Uncharacterized protein n=2 Tax=Clostridium saccharobutylicum TaxID=169679 RepID=U5MRV1_CLOSA|nr:hypothetical protein CLSA_c25360 [Clostridium saccharobutylicum DSM 13864]AQR90805.1 hypothetical protein CLOSC_25260 [Clostridium saccharobutylicum]AQS00709.1 hypothetical protein CSACC_25330 [Clostridium saccharobutylicum]AQS10368.1 hypothetical protein CLOBY_25110 [Clostridium saccharobutylicum]AQS14692.1 hypothetical protein CLOSACC_25330 [Clostridium saccharobutylicum]
MEKKKAHDLNSDKVLLRILLKKLGYEEEVIDKVCEVIK